MKFKLSFIVDESIKTPPVNILYMQIKFKPRLKYIKFAFVLPNNDA